MKKFISILFLQLHFTVGFSQTADTLFILPATAEKPARPVLKVKQFIVPAVAITYGLLSIGNGPLNGLNRDVKNEFARNGFDYKTKIDDYTRFLPAATAFGLEAFGVKGRNKIKDKAIVYAMAMAISATTVFPIKKITRQMRPDSSSKDAFPSGHAAAAFVAAEFLRKEYSHISPWIGIGGYVIAAGTGYLRLQNNKHWLGDIVAGAGIGIASTQLAYFIHDRVKWSLMNKSNTFIIPTYENHSLGVSIIKRF